MGNGIHGWIGGRHGSPTEYGLPLDDSYLYEDEDAADPEPSQPCPCEGAEWLECVCQAGQIEKPLHDPDLMQREAEKASHDGDDWTPVKIKETEPYEDGIFATDRRPSRS